MFIFIPFLVIAVFVAMWWARRGSTLTRDCRWREDRSQAKPGMSHYRCMACGAHLDQPDGKEPRQCRRPVAD